MRLLVTGGAGFIGSNYVKQSISQGNEVIVYDALTYAGNLDNLKEIEENDAYKFIHGDVCDLEKLNRAIKGCDGVVHFAAESHVDRSITNPGPFIETNCIGTGNLCEVVVKNQIEKYVHVSTDEVYGSIGTKIGEGSFTERDQLNPSSPYSATKAAGDLIVLSYHQTHDMPVSIIRPSNNYGPNQYPEKVIPLFITNLLEKKPVPLYGDGLHIRDWCNVEDTCKAIDTVLQKGDEGSIYNAGAGNEKTNLELAEKLVELCDAENSLINKVADRSGHDRRYSVNSDLINELGWTPQCDFEKGLENTVEWYRANRKWWEPLRNSNR